MWLYHALMRHCFDYRSRWELFPGYNTYTVLASWGSTNMITHVVHPIHRAPTGGWIHFARSSRIRARSVPCEGTVPCSPSLWYLISHCSRTVELVPISSDNQAMLVGHSRWLKTGVTKLMAPVLQLHLVGFPITCPIWVKLGTTGRFEAIVRESPLAKLLSVKKWHVPVDQASLLS
jgi:hypothetical protein